MIKQGFLSNMILELEELVMIVDGVVYRWSDDYMGACAAGYEWEYGEGNFLPLHD